MQKKEQNFAISLPFLDIPTFVGIANLFHQFTGNGINLLAAEDEDLTVLDDMIPLLF